MAKNKKRADGRYSCQVYLGKGPDGKRKYKTFYGSTLREAKAAADDFRSAVSKGMDPEQAEATLGTLYDNLIAAKKAKGIGQKSIDRLATNKAHWGELVDVPASELRAADFQRVLHNHKGQQMTEQGWKRLWESYMRDLNVKYGYDGQQNKNRPGGLPMRIDTFTPHQLRHTFCTLMYFAGVDVMTARDQMGHKDISVTLGIYTALDKKFKKKKINRLDTYLKKSCTQSG